MTKSAKSRRLDLHRYDRLIIHSKFYCKLDRHLIHKQNVVLLEKKTSAT